MAVRFAGYGIIVLAVLIIGLVAAAWTPDRPVAALAGRWAPPPSQFVPLDGMRVHVRDEGPRDDPLPIVMLHGTASSLFSWQGWADALKRDHRVIRFDRPGFALTGPHPDGDYSMRYYADFLARLLDRLGVERAVVAGNSSGGRMAWEFAAAYPDRVAGLVLVDAAGYPRSTPLPMGLRIAMSPWYGPLVEHMLTRSQVRSGLKSTFGDPGRVTDEMVERNYELTLRAGNRHALGATLRAAQGTDNSAAIPTIKAPTLILWGTHDTVIPCVPDADRFHHDIAGSRLVLLPGLGHTPQEEDPVDSVKPVAAFLAGLHRAKPSPPGG